MVSLSTVSWALACLVVVLAVCAGDAAPQNRKKPMIRLPAAAGAATPGASANKSPSDLVAQRPNDLTTQQPVGDQMLAEYLRLETAALADRCLAEIRTADDWNSKKEEYRRQLFEMLGLWPIPERTPLKPVITGKIDQPQYTVEKIHFQSMPRLYVTGSLYLPKNATGKVPAILYVSGHGQVKKDGIAYGTKASYQHHGVWFARHGYACLLLDTLESGEIEGEHHGVFRRGMWWWNARGYTPGGVEAWNSMRALDYLQSRPEIDGERLGITGRSGGGAYSWFTAALDERIKVAVPVAGITDLRNHVVDGRVEGHCDCMYVVNTYRWDYAQLAALIAPRPLLIANSDKDTIFPLDGVVRIHSQVRRIYQLLDAGDKLGLLITEGPHKDTQDLQLPAFRWFNRFLKKEDPLIEAAAVKPFAPEDLKVWPNNGLPSDQINTRIHETFTRVAPPPVIPDSTAEWNAMRDSLRVKLREKVFAAWPEPNDERTKGRKDEPLPLGAVPRQGTRTSLSSKRPNDQTALVGDLQLKEAFSVDRGGIRFRAWDFTPQPGYRLRLYLMQRGGADAKKPELVVLNILDDEGWRKWLSAARVGFPAEMAVPPLTTPDQAVADPDPAAFTEMQKMYRASNWAMAYLAPRGVGPTAWTADEKQQVQIRRRFMLLGQTIAGMQVWDARRAAQALRSVSRLEGVPLWLQGARDMSVVALYTGLFEPEVTRIDLWQLPSTHMDGPDLLNVLTVLDVPQAVALAAARSKVKIYQPTAEGWEYPIDLGKQLGWDPKQVDVRVVPAR